MKNTTPLDTPLDEIAVPPETVRLERTLPHSPRRVWRALTQPEAIEKWLLSIAPSSRGDAPRPLDTTGESVTLRATPTVRIAYEVAEADGERRLSLWWRVISPESGEQKALTTRVTWTLIPEQDGAATRLVIEHAPLRAAATVSFGGALARLALFLVLDRGQKRRSERRPRGAAFVRA
ncbi:MAG: SRPBCC domain-containing protein [Cytophagales bacterium]|nr:SRPBCC domain-containing protein [Armatimonadota bacterium]